ncbi:MAG: transpeptidase family protein [Candidatus Glassbacteria bacterium]|nr:transpeptidase family protein [Candidatus Glassbacteria bacterium]
MIPPRHAVKRLVLLVSGLFTVYAVVLGHLFVIQVLDHEKHLAEAERQHKRRINLPSKRGQILDCRGDPLAVSAEGLDIYAVPDQIKSKKQVAGILAGHLGIPEQPLLKRISGSRSFVMIRQKVNPAQTEKLQELELDGIGFIPSSKRYYPRHGLAAQVIGYVGLDEDGLTGLEFKYDKQLRGKPGWLVIQRDARGKPHNLLEYPLSEQTNGFSLRLSIEAEFQEIVEEALRRAVTGSGAKNGCIIAVDPDDGRILALANYPSADLNSRDTFRKNDFLNLAINLPYEPGSTIKPLTAAAMLSAGCISMDDTVFCERGVYTFQRRTIKDVHPYGNLSVFKVLVNSSNIGMAKLIRKIPDKKLYRSLRAFGLGSYTGECFSGEDKGLLPLPRDWDPATKTSLGIGYGLLATPLQMTMAYAALANGGTLYEPSLVEEIFDEQGDCRYRFSPRPVRRVLPEEIARQVVRSMVAVVDSGTGRSAAVPGYKVAGKTGTSMKASPGSGYDGAGYISSFGGFFPAEEAQLAIYITINSPSYSLRWGGSCAAPAFSEIISNTLVSQSTVIDRSRLNLGSSQLLMAAVEPDSPPPATGPGAAAQPSPGLPASKRRTPGSTLTMPKLTGLTMRQAVETLSGLGLKVSISGGIRVLSQKPAPGTVLSRGITCVLQGLQPAKQENSLALAAKAEKHQSSQPTAKGDR